MILQTGDLFRRFRVLGNAGQGGMGVVYRAHDLKLGRDVALKCPGTAQASRLIRSSLTTTSEGSIFNATARSNWASCAR
jgi:serine/threonine protein kinase